MYCAPASPWFAACSHRCKDCGELVGAAARRHAQRGQRRDRTRMALQCGALVPERRGLAVHRHSLAVDHDIAEPGLRKRVARLRGAREPAQRLPGILFHVLALIEQERKRRLRVGVPVRRATLQELHHALRRRRVRIPALKLPREQAGGGRAIEFRRTDQPVGGLNGILGQGTRPPNTGW